MLIFLAAPLIWNFWPAMLLLLLRGLREIFYNIQIYGKEAEESAKKFSVFNSAVGRLSLFSCHPIIEQQ